MTVDGEGNVLSVAVSEPRFTPREKALLLAARRAANAPRGRHGILLSEATDVNLQDQWVAEPMVDFAQKTLNATEDEWRKKHGDKFDWDAMQWRVRRKD